jgi:hypothetical protein
MPQRHARLMLVVATALLALTAAPLARAQTSNWVQIASSGPSVRSGPASAYDPVSGNVVLFGGYQDTETGVVYLNDTWLFDGTTWTQATSKSAPSPRTSTTMAYDAVTGEIILYGGWDGANRLGDTWAWDGKRTKWIKQRTKNIIPRVSGAMAFQDPITGHVELIGGFDGQFYHNTTYRWNGRGWDTVSTANPPFARAHGICTLNSVLKQVVMFGGLGDVNPNNTWTFDGADWTLQNPANQPIGRYYSGSAYDANAGGVVFFGAGYSDTWVWDGSNWTQLVPTNSPSPRLLYAMTGDGALNHPILFGGEDTEGTMQFNDTWEFITGP